MGVIIALFAIALIALLFSALMAASIVEAQGEGVERERVLDAQSASIALTERQRGGAPTPVGTWKAETREGWGVVRQDTLDVIGDGTFVADVQFEGSGVQRAYRASGVWAQEGHALSFTTERGGKGLVPADGVWVAFEVGHNTLTFMDGAHREFVSPAAGSTTETSLLAAAGEAWNTKPWLAVIAFAALALGGAVVGGVFSTRH
jgi:hypothetical protein